MKKLFLLTCLLFVVCLGTWAQKIVDVRTTENANEQIYKSYKDQEKWHIVKSDKVYIEFDVSGVTSQLTDYQVDNKGKQSIKRDNKIGDKIVMISEELETGEYTLKFFVGEYNLTQVIIDVHDKPSASISTEPSPENGDGTQPNPAIFNNTEITFTAKPSGGIITSEGTSNGWSYKWNNDNAQIGRTYTYNESKDGNVHEVTLHADYRPDQNDNGLLWPVDDATFYFQFADNQEPEPIAVSSVKTISNNNNEYQGYEDSVIDTENGTETKNIWNVVEGNEFVFGFSGDFKTVDYVDGSSSDNLSKDNENNLWILNLENPLQPGKHSLNFSFVKDDNLIPLEVTLIVHEVPSVSISTTPAPTNANEENVGDNQGTAAYFESLPVTFIAGINPEGEQQWTFNWVFKHEPNGDDSSSGGEARTCGLPAGYADGNVHLVTLYGAYTPTGAPEGLQWKAERTYYFKVTDNSTTAISIVPDVEGKKSDYWKYGDVKLKAVVPNLNEGQSITYKWEKQKENEDSSEINYETIKSVGQNVTITADNYKGNSRRVKLTVTIGGKEQNPVEYTIQYVRLENLSFVSSGDYKVVRHDEVGQTIDGTWHAIKSDTLNFVFGVKNGPDNILVQATTQDSENLTNVSPTNIQPNDNEYSWSVQPLDKDKKIEIEIYGVGKWFYEVKVYDEPSISLSQSIPAINYYESTPEITWSANPKGGYSDGWVYTITNTLSDDEQQNTSFTLPEQTNDSIQSQEIIVTLVAKNYAPDEETLWISNYKEQKITIWPKVNVVPGELTQILSNGDIWNPSVEVSGGKNDKWVFLWQEVDDENNALEEPNTSTEVSYTYDNNRLSRHVRLTLINNQKGQDSSDYSDYYNEDKNSWYEKTIDFYAYYPQVDTEEMCNVRFDFENDQEDFLSPSQNGEGKQPHWRVVKGTTFDYKVVFKNLPQEDSLSYELDYYYKTSKNGINHRQFNFNEQLFKDIKLDQAGNWFFFIKILKDGVKKVQVDKTVKVYNIPEWADSNSDADLLDINATKELNIPSVSGWTGSFSVPGMENFDGNITIDKFMDDDEHEVKLKMTHESIGWVKNYFYKFRYNIPLPEKVELVCTPDVRNLLPGSSLNIGYRLKDSEGNEIEDGSPIIKAFDWDYIWDDNSSSDNSYTFTAENPGDESKTHSISLALQRKKKGEAHGGLVSSDPLTITIWPSVNLDGVTSSDNYTKEDPYETWKEEIESYRPKLEANVKGANQEGWSFIWKNEKGVVLGEDATFVVSSKKGSHIILDLKNVSPDYDGKNDTLYTGSRDYYFKFVDNPKMPEITLVPEENSLATEVLADTEVPMKLNNNDESNNDYNYEWDDGTNIFIARQTTTEGSEPQMKKLTATRLRDGKIKTAVYEFNVWPKPEVLSNDEGHNTNEKAKDLFDDETWTISPTVKGGYTNGWEYYWSDKSVTTSNTLKYDMSEDRNRLLTLTIKNVAPENALPKGEWYNKSFDYYALFTTVNLERISDSDVIADDMIKAKFSLVGNNNMSLYTWKWDGTDSIKNEYEVKAKAPDDDMDYKSQEVKLELFRGKSTVQKSLAFNVWRKPELDDSWAMKLVDEGNDKNEKVDGIREANVLGLPGNPKMVGGFKGNDSYWKYKWTFDGKEVTGNTYIIPSVNTPTDYTVSCEALNMKGDSIMWNGVVGEKTITVYPKPKLPESVVLKGNGNSNTWIVSDCPSDIDGLVASNGKPDKASADSVVTLVDGGSSKWFRPKTTITKNDMRLYAIKKYVKEGKTIIITSDLLKEGTNGNNSEVWDGSVYDYTRGTRGEESSAPAALPEGIYSINGMKTDELVRGLNIIRMEDGTVKKVFKK